MHEMKRLDKKMLKKILGPEGKKVTGYWMKLQSKETNKIYSSPNIIRVIK
jgi:hypothetical protein